MLVGGWEEYEDEEELVQVLKHAFADGEEYTAPPFNNQSPTHSVPNRQDQRGSKHHLNARRYNQHSNNGNGIPPPSLA